VTDQVAALGISYKINVDKDGRREIVLQTHVASDQPIHVLDAMLDKMRKAMDRQAAVYDLEKAREDLASLVSTLHEFESQVALQHELSRARWVQENRRGEWAVERLSAQERTAVDGINQSILKYRGAIERAQATIERLEPLVEPDAVDVSADRDPRMSGG
jgi:uncharacterized coiled-coil protein SlyX